MKCPTRLFRLRRALPTKWVGYANEHAAETGGKEWRYVLVPHDAVGKSATLAGLVARYQTHA